MKETNKELIDKAVKQLEMLEAENIDATSLNDILSSIENLKARDRTVHERESEPYHLDGKDVDKSFSDFNQKIAEDRKRLKKVIVLDTETTGFSPRYDDLLQLSIIDGNGNTLFNSHLKPERKKSWKEAEAVNHISPDMVKDSPRFKDVREDVQKIIDQADLIVSYNGKFDTNFLQMAGIRIPENKPHLDVMKAFAPVYGEKNTKTQAIRRQGEYKWQTLGTATDHFNIDLNAHDSLEDVKATLMVAKRIYGMGLENLKPEDIEKNGIKHTPPKALLEKENNAFSGYDGEKNKAFVFGKTVLPPFVLMTSKGLVNCSNAVVKGYDQNTESYLIEDGEQKIRIPKSTFESVFKPEREIPVKRQFSNEDVLQAEETPSVVFGETLIPEFSILTQSGMKTYRDMKVEKYNPDEDRYILSNGDSTISVSKESFIEATKPERLEKTFSKNTPEYEKLLETQYRDYFTQRDNTAGNFRHNFAVYCRKESNSPVDAVQISRELFSRMSREEQKKTRMLMEQIKKDDETMTQCLMRMYFEAVKEVPLNEEYIKQNKPGSVIARPFYDTITAKGALLDPDLSIRIGDTVTNLSFSVDNPFSKGREKVTEPLSIVSSSKEGNMIVMMNKDKSYYQVPRDEFLKEYLKSNEKQHKAEMKVSRTNSMEIER